jgi:hypothetical protein
MRARRRERSECRSHLNELSHLDKLVGHPSLIVSGRWRMNIAAVGERTDMDTATLPPPRELAVELASNWDQAKEKASEHLSRIIELHAPLYAGSFLVPVRAGSEAAVASAAFYTYACRDNVRELPVFTRRDFVFADLPAAVVLISVPGSALWPRLLDIVKAGECEAAVDPGQEHGVRLRREMILGMVAEYGPGNRVGPDLFAKQNLTIVLKGDDG